MFLFHFVFLFSSTFNTKMRSRSKPKLSIQPFYFLIIIAKFMNWTLSNQIGTCDLHAFHDEKVLRIHSHIVFSVIFIWAYSRTTAHKLTARRSNLTLSTYGVNIWWSAVRLWPGPPDHQNDSIRPEKLGDSDRVPWIPFLQGGQETLPCSKWVSIHSIPEEWSLPLSPIPAVIGS